MSTSFQGTKHFATLGEVKMRRFPAPVKGALPRGAVRRGAAPATMRCFFSGLTGLIVNIDTHPDDTVSAVKAQIVSRGGAPGALLVFKGRRMEDGQPLSAYQVFPGATLYEECADLRALIDFHAELNGLDWASSKASASNLFRHEADQKELAEMDGEGAEHTDPSTKKVRYVHSSRQAAFDCQSLGEYRHLTSPNQWPKQCGSSEDFAGPGGVKLRRDGWRVKKPDPVPLLPPADYNPRVALRGAAKAAFEAKALADAEAARVAAVKAAELAAKASKLAYAPVVKKEAPTSFPVPPEEERLEGEGSVPTTDPQVDFWSPANWFGVTAGPVRGRLRVTALKLTANGLSGDLPLHAIGSMSGLTAVDLSGQSFAATPPPDHERTVAMSPVKPAGALRGWVSPGRPGTVAYPYPYPSDWDEADTADGDGGGGGGSNTSKAPGGGLVLGGMKALFGGGGGGGGGAWVDKRGPSFADLPRLTSLDLSCNLLTGPLPGAPIPKWAKDLYGVKALKKVTAAMAASRALSSLGAAASKASAGSLAGAGGPGSLVAGKKAHGAAEAALLEAQHQAAAFALEHAPLGWRCQATLRELKLSENRLTGPLPLAMSSLVGLEVLRLDGNRLTGPLRADLVSAWASLQVLTLGSNLLTGPLPAGLGDSCPNLHHLALDGNKFAGNVPGSLGSCLGLARLDLSRNRLLTGRLPVDAWLAPRPCPLCNRPPRSTDGGGDDDFKGDCKNDRKNLGFFSGGGLRAGGCVGTACESGWVAPLRRLEVLGVEMMPRVAGRHDSVAQLLRVLEPATGLRVYIEPFLPFQSPESADAEDAAELLRDAAAAKAAAEAAAAKAAKDNAAFDEVQARMAKRNKELKRQSMAGMAGLGEGGQGGEEDEEEAAAAAVAANEAAKKAAEAAKAAEERAREEATDAPMVKEWRLAAAAGAGEATVQLAIAYELGLFGLKVDLKRAIALYASLNKADDASPDAAGGKKKASRPTTAAGSGDLHGDEGNNDVNDDYAEDGNEEEDEEEDCDGEHPDDNEEEKAERAVWREAQEAKRAERVKRDAKRSAAAAKSQAKKGAATAGGRPASPATTSAGSKFGPRGCVLAFEEVARLEAAVISEFVGGGAAEEAAGEAEGGDGKEGEEAAPPAKTKAVRVKPGPIMATFGTSVYSRDLEGTYDRQFRRARK